MSPSPVDKRRAPVDDLATLGPGYSEFRTDYEPILRASHPLEAKVQMETAHARQSFTTAGPGAWHGTSASVPATTVVCTNNAEVPDGVLGALDTHEFVYARLMGLGDALGCASALPSAL